MITLAYNAPIGHQQLSVSSALTMLDLKMEVASVWTTVNGIQPQFYELKSSLA